MAAAITGRTAAYGLHLEGPRRASLEVQVNCPIRTLADFGALGYLVGKRAQNRVPLFRVGSSGLDESTQADLKALGAAMAASGAVALYHVEGVTPEADRPDILLPDHDTFRVDNLRPAYAALNADAREIDLVWFGCPHASLDEIRQILRLLNGRRVVADLWISTSRDVRQRALEHSLVEAIETSGGCVVADMCVVVAPMEELDYQTLATPSAKGATYVPSHTGLLTRYGTVEQCVEAAVTGLWPS
jgi:hypothetical protein